jgi:putative OPT family oligopeptide transporter
MATATEPNGSSGNEEGFEPVVSHKESPPEFTVMPIVVGSVLGIIFAASSLYLVLKVGMTVSASIPVAVVAITLSRFLWKKSGQKSILQNNIVQTAGSAGESIAFGVGVTMPALLLLGFDMTLARVMVVSLLGGCLGILAMIPLRRVLVVRLHRELAYPEGRACAMVLQAGETETGATPAEHGEPTKEAKKGGGSLAVFSGFILAFLHKVATEGMALLVSTWKLPLKFVHKTAVFANEMASELLGVGYIIGLRTSAIMMGGAFLGYLVIIPLLSYIGSNSEVPVPPGDKLISEMSTKELRDNYLLFVGAGCVATAGIISMLRTLPMIVRSVVDMTKGSKAGGGAATEVRRTERDMSLRTVMIGSAALLVVLAGFLFMETSGKAASPLILAIGGALLVVVFGFLFVTVSSRLTGEIGSSSNPISGMTVATLTMTCLIFLALGYTSSIERVLALSIAAVVCVAASNGGTTAQSLKTGHLVGATPKSNQYAILIGAVSSALVIGGTLLLFNSSGTIYSSKAENLPNITLTSEEVARLRDNQGETEHEKEKFVVWDTRRDTFAESESYKPHTELASVKTGRYLVDGSTGRVRWVKDFTIMGKLTETDDGKEVKRAFDAPKTQVMGIIINGVLSKKLNWSLILIGALIAVVLELCGVSALAFAVGLYVPIQFSAPIFVGGIVRWVVDKYMSRQVQADTSLKNMSKEQAEAEAIRRSETSPGTLLAAGYIAGGSLAGMLIAFTNFSETLPDWLTQWQYSKETTTQVVQVKSLDDAVADLNKGEIARWTPIKKGTKVRLPKKEIYVADRDLYLGDIAKEKLGGEGKASKLMDLNREELIPHVKVNKGTTIRLADYTYYNVEVDTTLGELSDKTLKTKDSPAILLARNSDKLPDRLENKGKDPLKLPDVSPDGVIRIDTAKELPAGAVLKQPQKDWPAIVAFGALVAILAVVGTGIFSKRA